MLEKLWPHCMSSRKERRLYIIHQKKVKKPRAGFSLRSDYKETGKEFLCSLLTIAYIMDNYKPTLKKIRITFRISYYLFAVFTAIISRSLYIFTPFFTAVYIVERLV
jgi:hypothetical protein